MKWFYFIPRYKFITYRQNHWYEFCIKYNLGYIKNKQHEDITANYEEIEYKPSLYFSCYLFEMDIKLPFKHYSFRNIKLTEEEINNHRCIVLSDILNKK